MNTAPDTQQDRIDAENAEFCEAVAAYLDEFEADAIDMTTALEPILAAIRRHAAADALRRKARSFDNSARMFRDMSAARDRKGDHQSATIYASHAMQARTDAEALRKEADGIIAEGYEFECAAFSQECDQRVPDAGDFCKQHEPEDDEDRWAE